MSSASGSDRLRPLTTAAMVSAAVMMAYQVASRATRDTLFLSNFDVTSLPLMIAVTAALAIVVALGATRAMSAYGPARVIPALFLISAVLTLGEWALVVRRPALGAIAVYVHVATLGSVLISGFWAILSEEFDPRTAKKAIGRIAGMGTLGGILGGLLAERLTAGMGPSGALPAMALAHLGCAWGTSRLPVRVERDAAPAEPSTTMRATEAQRRLLTTPYLRNLALLVLGSSVSAALLDFVFKAQTAGMAHRSLDLMRVFSAFYSGVAVLTLVIQTLLSRLALERAGLARTIGALPAAVVASGVVAWAIPGPWSVSLARGLEAVFRGSLFRGGVELLYTPIPAAEKRATKTLVDVGCDRLGEVAGAGLIVIVLSLAPLSATRMLLAISVLLAVATLVLVARLQRGYVSSLEAGLRVGAVHLDRLDVVDMTTRTTLQRAFGIKAAEGPIRDLDLSRAFEVSALSPAVPRDLPGIAPAPAPAQDEVTERLCELRSSDPARVATALAAAPLDPALVPQAIRLLARDDVAHAAAHALSAVVTEHVGQLVDALLDPGSDFAVRRRIPGVLVASRTTRVVEGLTRGLADDRFEVRYRCGRALARMLEREGILSVDHELILAAVRREATVGRSVWESQRLLDQLEDRGEDPFVDDFLRDRAGRSLEHVFTLLSMVLPREPLQIAFRGLHAGDPILRGLGLEYLESVLPPPVSEVLWPYLEPDRAARRGPRPPPRDRDQVLNDLIRSNQTVRINLEVLRRPPREETDP